MPKFSMVKLEAAMSNFMKLKEKSEAATKLRSRGRDELEKALVGMDARGHKFDDGTCSDGQIMQAQISTTSSVSYDFKAMRKALRKKYGKEQAKEILKKICTPRTISKDLVDAANDLGLIDIEVIQQVGVTKSHDSILCAYVKDDEDRPDTW